MTMIHTNRPTTRTIHTAAVALLASALALGGHETAGADSTGAAGATSSRPDVIAAVTDDARVVIVDSRTGELLREVHGPEDGGPGQAVERGPDGTIYYEVLDADVGSAVRSFDPATGERRRFGRGRRPAVDSSGTRLAVIVDGAPVVIRTIDLVSGARANYPLPAPNLVGDITWMGPDLVVLDTYDFAGPVQGLSSFRLSTGELIEPTGDRARLQGKFSAGRLRRGDVTALVDPDFQLGAPRVGERIVEAPLDGGRATLVRRGEWLDLSLSDDARWLVAAATDGTFTIRDPRGGFSTVASPDRVVAVDLDW